MILLKCDFCNKNKKTVTIFTTDDKPVRNEICETCAKIECPYLDWNKLLDLNSLEKPVNG